MAGGSVKGLHVDVRSMEGIDDFERLAERIRTHSREASGSDTERVTMRSFEEASYEALRELSEAFDGEDVDPGACVFYLSQANVERALEGEDEGDVEALEDRLGRELRVEESMPDDTILFMDPDAIDEDGEVVAASAIACGTVVNG
jgi:hypothetical protein